MSKKVHVPSNRQVLFIQMYRNTDCFFSLVSTVFVKFQVSGSNSVCDRMNFIHLFIPNMPFPPTRTKRSHTCDLIPGECAEAKGAGVVLCPLLLQARATPRITKSTLTKHLTHLLPGLHTSIFIAQLSCY